LAIEFNKNLDVFVYLDSLSIKKSYYFSSKISKKEWDKIRDIMVKNKNLYSIKSDLPIYDATKYEIDLKLNDFDKNVILNQTDLTDEIFTIISSVKSLKLKTIKNHEFVTKMQFEVLP
jgi:spore cortex formation protein SpoVR/YcgB (stage V sporulation)